LNDAVKQWSAYAARLAAAPVAAPAQTNPPSAPENPGPLSPQTPRQTPGLMASQTPANPVDHPPRYSPAGPRPRTHTVAPGETAAAIARKFGIKLSALESANPSMNPNRIRAGQVLNLPPP